MKCYCCSGKTFAECCEPLIKGIAKAPTAEASMRSRYSAYATVSVNYLLNTTHRSTRRSHNAKAIEAWAKSSSWEKLEIISTVHGGVEDLIGVVEFKAYFRDLGLRQKIHHESSNFIKESGEWYFVDGRIV